MNEKSPVIGRNRPANNPGRMQCERCGEIFIGEERHTLCGICIQRTADEIAEAQQPDTRPPSQPGRVDVAPVKRIEMVDFSSGFKMPADPEWRIEIGGYCADFPTETAANNFRAAILSLTKGTETGADGKSLDQLVFEVAAFVLLGEAQELSSETRLKLSKEIAQRSKVAFASSALSRNSTDE